MTLYPKLHHPTPLTGLNVLPQAVAGEVVCVSGRGFRPELRLFNNRTRMTTDNNPGLLFPEAAFFRTPFQERKVWKPEVLEDRHLPLHHRGKAGRLNLKAVIAVNLIAFSEPNLRLFNFS